MKITIDVELQESEMTWATQVRRALEEFNGGNVDVRVTMDKASLEARIQEAMGTRAYDVMYQELLALLTNPSTTEDTLDVVCSTAFFSTQRVERGQPLDPFVAVVAHLRDGVRQTVRVAVVQRAVDHLSRPRRLDCSRLPLLPFCETIAAFVKADLLSLHSVVGTVAQMIQQTATRTAGITCLGKVVEMAQERVLASDRTTLERIRTAIATAQHDDLFAYDVDYISEALGLTQSKYLYGLRRTRTHHKSPILALAYSGGSGMNYREAVVTSSADATIGTWDASGEVTESIRLSRHYAASLDLAARGHMLIVGGAGTRPGTSPVVILYDEQPENGSLNSRWAENGAVEPKNAQFITAVRGTRTTSTDARYCVAVSTHSGENKLLVYDGTHHVQEYTEHSDMITSLHRFADDAMLTGSRDRTVKLYDLRDGNTRQAEMRHTNTITSIGSCGDYIFTAGLDKRLAVVDVRMVNRELASLELDSPILSLAVSASRTCAVATVTGLYTINLASFTPSRPPLRVHCGTNSPRYNAISWNAGGSVLYAGGVSASLDVFDRQYSENDGYDV